MIKFEFGDGGRERRRGRFESGDDGREVLVKVVVEVVVVVNVFVVAGFTIVLI